MPPIRRSVALLAFIAAPAVSTAQSTSPPAGRPELIPRELVLALLSFSGPAGGTDIRVGTAPDDIPPELVPPGAQIVGSMTQFGNVVLILGMREAPDSAIGTMETHTQMRAAGRTSLQDGTVEFVSARGYRKKDEKNVEWTAVLVAMKVADSRTMDVSLRVARR